MQELYKIFSIMIKKFGVPGVISTDCKSALAW
jgi:hypothetical protein